MKFEKPLSCTAILLRLMKHFLIHTSRESLRVTIVTKETVNGVGKVRQEDRKCSI